MPVSSSRVFISFINQPLNGMFSIASNGGGCTKSCTNKFIVHYKYPEVKTRNKLFAYYRAAVFPGCFQCTLCLLIGCYVGGCPFAMITIYRFYYKRKSYFVNGSSDSIITV